MGVYKTIMNHAQWFLKAGMMKSHFDHLMDLISNKHWSIGFHGSAQAIDKFSDQKVGQGADVNSSLGLFLSYLPESAYQYAEIASGYHEGSHPRVYAVCFPAKGVYQMQNREEFYGTDEYGSVVATAEEFMALRRELLQEGFDCIEFDDGEDSMAVVIKPSKSIIIAELDEDACFALNGHEFNAVSTLFALKDCGLLKEQLARKRDQEDSPSP